MCQDRGSPVFKVVEFAAIFMVIDLIHLKKIPPLSEKGVTREDDEETAS